MRYVGSRFQIVFHLAGELYYLRENLLIYLGTCTSCRNTTSLRSALQKDLRNDKLLLQLQALGIIAKLRRFFTTNRNPDRFGLRVHPH